MVSSATGALLAAALLLAPACRQEAGAAAEQDGARLPALAGRVVDQADLLTPADELALAADSSAVERDTGAQFVIVTIPSLQGRPIEEYGVKLARKWAIGRKGADDGVLLIVAPAERKARIEVGYGLEKRLTDPFAARVMREDMIPQFGQGRFGPGIKAGSARIIGRLRSKASDREIAAQDHLVI